MWEGVSVCCCLLAIEKQQLLHEGMTRLCSSCAKRPFPCHFEFISFMRAVMSSANAKSATTLHWLVQGFFFISTNKTPESLNSGSTLFQFALAEPPDECVVAQISLFCLMLLQRHNKLPVILCSGRVKFTAFVTTSTTWFIFSTNLHNTSFDE